MIEELITAMDRALEALRARKKREIKLFHHNDADGLTSGAILTRALTRDGFTVRRFALEKSYPAILERILGGSGETILFADFAGRIAPRISALNAGKNLVLILDHHAAAPAADPQVHNLDPDLHGMKGDLDISASVTCWLFAKRMDARNADLAHLAALGAVGDRFFLEGKLVSENRLAVREAVARGSMRVAALETGENYYFPTPKGEVAGDAMAEYLETLGGVGYYREGPEMGIDVCLNGFSPESDRMFGKLKALREEKFQEEARRLKAGQLQRTDHLQWFHVQERFAPMGVKMIGAFCDTVRNSDFIDPERYLAGFQSIRAVIPGFGPVPMNDVKVSMRVATLLENRIRGGTALGLNRLLPEATGRVGGFSDACHSLAAATTVGVGKEERLVAEMENILKASI